MGIKTTLRTRQAMAHVRPVEGVKPYLAKRVHHDQSRNKTLVGPLNKYTLMKKVLSTGILSAVESLHDVGQASLNLSK